MSPTQQRPQATWTNDGRAKNLYHSNFVLFHAVKARVTYSKLTTSARWKPCNSVVPLWCDPTVPVVLTGSLKAFPLLCDSGHLFSSLSALLGCSKSKHKSAGRGRLTNDSLYLLCLFGRIMSIKIQFPVMNLQPRQRTLRRCDLKMLLSLMEANRNTWSDRHGLKMSFIRCIQ